MGSALLALETNPCDIVVGGLLAGLLLCVCGAIVVLVGGVLCIPIAHGMWFGFGCLHHLDICHVAVVPIFSCWLQRAKCC